MRQSPLVLAMIMPQADDKRVVTVLVYENVYGHVALLTWNSVLLPTRLVAGLSVCRVKNRRR